MLSVQFYPSTQAKHQAVHETQVLRRYHQEDYHATQISPTNVPKDQRIKTSQFGVSAENWSKRKKIQRKHPKFGGWCPMVFRVLAATFAIYIYIYQSSDRCNFTNQICTKTCRYLSSRKNSLLFMRLLLCWRCSPGTKTAEHVCPWSPSTKTSLKDSSDTPQRVFITIITL